MKNYTIIPVYDTVILTGVEYQLGTEDFSQEERERIERDGNKVLIVPTREYCSKKNISMDKIRGLGVLADVLDIKVASMGTRLHAIAREKVRITDADYIAGIPEGSYLPIEEVADLTKSGEKILLESLRKTALDNAAQFQNSEMIQSFIRKCKTINELAGLVCPFLEMTPDEKYSLLVTDSLKERGLAVKGALLRFRGTIDMQIELQERYDDNEGLQYKKAAILKQIASLKQSLSEMNPDEQSIEDEYRQKIEASGMNEEAKKEVERTLQHFLSAQPNDPERNTLENYLNFVTELKWTSDELPEIDLDKARKILDRDHYGMEKVKERILEELAVMKLKNRQTGTILLLAGAPGTGKTSIGRSVAEALGRKYVRISLGGIRDEAEIRGHRRTYIGAMPGRIMEGIKRSGAMNPVIVLDETDKLTSGSLNGDPAGALLEVLDPEQNNTFTDHYMNIPYDLSDVFFICTANNIDTIPQPLLDRMEVIRLSGYTPADKLQIAKKHLFKRALEDAGLTKADLRLTDGAFRRVIAEYTMESGVRGLKKQLDKICRHEAAALVKNGRGEKVTVKEKDIPEIMGDQGIRHDKALRESVPGIATGLAWTQAGGEILFIEAASMKGSGQLRLTGQLGDVMKESASIALSLAKARFSDSEENWFAEKDLHIHVPAGAVPKDGPSAGVTIFTALVSLITGRPVRTDLAMTGEISLRGQVLPIGGLPEKLMAAERAGIKKVLIPHDNECDLKDVPEEIRKTLTIVPVTNAEEVLKEALMEAPL